MKVGITFTGVIDKLFTNGINYNVILWYNFLELCGYEPYLIYGTYKDEQYEHTIDKFNYTYKCIHYSIKQYRNITTLKNFKELKIIFNIGLSHDNLFNLIKKNNKILIYVMLGNLIQHDVQNIIQKDYNIIRINYDYNEVWISPHFEYSKDYLEMRYKTKVVVCPYIWEPLLLNTYDLKNKIKPIENTIDVAIMEPNINYCKTCLIPISICELNEKDIDNVYVFGAHHLKENKFVKEVLMKKEIIQKGKTSFEHRVPITDIVSKYCNVVVSCNENCDLNYVFLECFYLGIPLVHNSEFLKDYGYYYPDLRINKTLGMFEEIKKKFNKTDYIEKHKEVLFKYSMHNPMNQAWIQYKIDCLLQK